MVEVKLIEVIMITHTIGRGVSDDPLRPFVQFFDKDGNKLNMGDYTTEPKDSLRNYERDAVRDRLKMRIT